MSKVILSASLAFRRGRRMFSEGATGPENHWSDEEWNGPLTEGRAEWLGWMLERALTLYQEEKRRDAVRDYIEYGIDLPPGLS